MNALNQIILEGNVVRQAEKKSFGNVTVCSVPIAVNRAYKGNNGEYVNEVSFFDITTFGSLAEKCDKWCLKGRGIRVVGRLKQSTWEDDSGKKQSKIEIIAEHIEFKPVSKKTDDNNSEKTYSPNSKRTFSKQEKFAMVAEAVAAQGRKEEVAF